MPLKGDDFFEMESLTSPECTLKSAPAQSRLDCFNSLMGMHISESGLLRTVFNLLNRSVIFNSTAKNKNHRGFVSYEYNIVVIKHF